MPTPGPRSQFGPDPGYNNPGLEQPNRINFWKRPGPLYWPGRSPGLTMVSLRGNILGAGQIRRWWRQSINLIPAQAPYSWTGSSPSPDHPTDNYGGVGITRALRYLTHSLYIGGGLDHSRYDALHTVVNKQNAYKQVTVNVGQVRGRPTIRNRLASFGSRVPTLNQTVMAAENQNPGRSTQ